MQYGDLKWAGRTTNPTGAGNRFFIAYLEEIKSHPVIPSSGVTASEAVCLPEGDIVMEDGCTFIEFYSSDGKAEVTSSPEGDTDCQAFVDKVVAKYPDIDDAAVATAYSMLNANCVIIAPTKIHSQNTPQYVILGIGQNCPKLTPSLMSGKALGDEKGLSLEATCEVEIPLLRYNGAVPVDGGSWDLATNLYTADVEA